MTTDSSLDIYFDFAKSPSFSESPRLAPFSESSEADERFSLSDVISDEEDHPNVPQEINSSSSLLPDEIASLLLEKSKRIYKKPKNSKKALKSPQNSLSNPIRTRKAWTASEDKMLLDYMKEYEGEWSKIASHIPNRTGKQVRDRYLSVLSSHIVKKKTWTEEEDREIIRLREEMGPQWCRIAELLEGRTDAQVKNRYNTHLSKRKRKGVNEKNVEILTAETSPKEVADQTRMRDYFVESEGLLFKFNFEN